MDFQSSVGKRSAELLDELFASDDYQDLSDSQKVSVVEDIYGFATAMAKSELKYDYKTLSAMIGENSNGKPYLSESDYKKLSAKAKKEYAKEYFLSKAEMRYINDYESLISHYIKQSK